MQKLVDKISEQYGIDIISYGRLSSGILICGGTGLMMGVMDQCPGLNYCIDFDAYRGRKNIASFLRMVNSIFRPVCFGGWFFVTDPEPLLSAIAEETILYFRGKGQQSPGNCRDLQEFIREINALAPLHEYQQRLLDIKANEINIQK